MSIRLKSLLKESPDTLKIFGGKTYSYNDNTTIGIFSIVYIENKPVVVSVKISDLKIFIDDPQVAEKYKEKNYGNLQFHKMNFYHQYLHEPLYDAKLVSSIYRQNDEYLVCARVWKNLDGDSEFLCSFWQRHENVKDYLKKVDVALKSLRLDPHKGKFEFMDKQGTLYTYEESFGKSKVNIKSTMSDEQIKVLQKIQHLSPEAKKALITKYPPNRLQMAASKLGIPYIQLRHILTGPELVGQKSFEENLDLDSFLNNNDLSYSDYYNPDIPYEQKPVYSIKPM